MSKLQKGIAIIISLLVLFELSLFFSVNDLDIWIKIGNLDSKTALFMELLGKIVAPMIFIASGLIIAYYYSRENNCSLKLLKTVSGIVCACAGFGYAIFVFIEVKNIVLTVILSIALCGLTFLFLNVLKKTDQGRLFQLYCVALTAILYCIAVLAVISTIKLFWGRIRPRDLLSISEFTRWYIPQGITGNYSFPSGHTANASTLLVITMFIPIVKKAYSKILLVVVPAIWMVAMALSRVVIGAHYCSDTLFAIAISITVFILSKKFTTFLIAKSLSNDAAPLLIAEDDSLDPVHISKTEL